MGLDKGFLDMLMQTLRLQRHMGRDEWGNSTYGPLESIKGFYDAETATQDSSANEGSAQQNPKYQRSGTLITDYIEIKPGDRFVLAHITGEPTKDDYRYAVSVDTGFDESGQPLFQTTNLGVSMSPVIPVVVAPPITP